MSGRASARPFGSTSAAVVTSWGDVVTDEPEFAARVRARFDAHRHKTIATLRADGSPRISGIEVAFTDDTIRIGMMPGSLKAADLMRDPRTALHSATVDPDDANPGAWPGEAKIAGAARPARHDGGDQTAEWFEIDVTEVVLTTIGDPADHLLIESWHPGRGLQQRKRT